MSILEDIRTYFKGERLENALLILLGLTAGAGAALIYLNYYHNATAHGLFWPLLCLSIFGLGTGGFNFAHNVYRLKTLDWQFSENPAAYIAQEKNRMQKLGKLKIPFLITWSLLIIAGTICLIVRQDIVKGVGIGILLIGITGHTIDFFAEKRNKRYRTPLQNAG